MKTPPPDNLRERKPYKGGDVSRFNSFIKTINDCWIWQGSVSIQGYGRFRYNGKSMQAHRASLLLNGIKLVEGLEVDHLCRNRKCVNPQHLEQVTRLVNVQRGNASAVRKEYWATRTHCARGHEYTDENTRRDNRGYRACKRCHREDAQLARERSKQLIIEGTIVEVREILLKVKNRLINVEDAEKLISTHTAKIRQAIEDGTPKIIPTYSNGLNTEWECGYNSAVVTGNKAIAAAFGEGV